jgi:hypothetical protein
MLAESIAKDTDAKQRFEAAIHDKELPHSIFSIGELPKGQDPDEAIRQKRAWQRVQLLKSKRLNSI